jgi:hypothetical protein
LKLTSSPLSILTGHTRNTSTSFRRYPGKAFATILMACDNPATMRMAGLTRVCARGYHGFSWKNKHQTNKLMSEGNLTKIFSEDLIFVRPTYDLLLRGLSNNAAWKGRAKKKLGEVRFDIQQAGLACSYNYLFQPTDFLNESINNATRQLRLKPDR